MEDVYTIKVKTKPDTRNLYPSERRYSASTVSGLAWVHIALAATSFLLACLALINPTSDIQRLNLNDTEESTINRNELMLNLTDFDVSVENNATEFNITNEDGSKTERKDKNYILVVAPTLMTVFALSAGIASIMASARWYVDRNITWLFYMSVLSTLFAFIAFVMIAGWYIATEDDISEFYKDKIPFNDFILVKHSDIVHKNESHIVIKTSNDEDKSDNSHLFTKRVLSINILIAAFLEILWSILSIKISYKGMRNNYKEDNERRGNAISVVTTIKGNTKNMPRNGKLLPTKPDLIDHYPSKIKRIFLEQGDNGFYLKNQNNKAKNTETSSEFYKERMMNFLNRCASQADNPENHTPSEQSETVLNAIPEVINAEVTVEIDQQKDNRVTPVSWGDTPDHTIYNQNNINFEKIFNFKKDDTHDAIENDTE